MAGSFVHTLSLTDVASGWTECVPLLVRESTLVIQAVEALRGVLPFLLRGLDADNGSEFVNDSLVRYCATHEATRPVKIIVARQLGTLEQAPIARRPTHRPQGAGRIARAH